MVSSSNTTGTYLVAYRTSSFNLAMRPLESFEDRCMVLFNLREGWQTQRHHQGHLRAFDNWFKAQIERTFKVTKQVDENDAGILCTIAQLSKPLIAMEKYARIQTTSKLKLTSAGSLLSQRSTAPITTSLWSSSFLSTMVSRVDQSF